MELLTSSLYQRVLMQPAIAGADTLKIVSGFASPAMALKHLHDLQGGVEQGIIKQDINIDLIYGMSKHNGVEKATHKGFIDIQVRRFINFKCYYSSAQTPTHAKVYTWIKNNEPIVCYTGSANYTQNGFARRLQQEAMTATNPVDGFNFYNAMFKHCIPCNDSMIEEYIPLYRSNKKKHTKSGLEEVELTLLNTRTGNTHEKAGLNWGQRTGRDHNQAYIPVPQKIAQSDFFPEKKEYFTVLSDDDDFSFIATIAQEGRKAIHSTENNAIIGKYFRQRLELEDGQYVEREHLESYGRTSVKFIKVDTETYIMDFAPHRDTAENETE